MTKKNVKDPYAAREAKKYDNPIPSREFIADYIKEYGRPIAHKRLAMELGLEDADQQEAIRRRLKAMERDGQLIRNRKGAFGLIKNMGLVKGRFSGHKDGFGFVIPEDGSEDVFLNPREALAVFHDDEVLVRVVGMNHKGKREAALVEVLVRNTEQVVGRFFEESGVSFVEPSGKRIKKDILIPSEHASEAKSGQFVVVDILHQPTRHSQAIGKISEILGDHMAPGMEIDVAIRGYQLPNLWSAEIKRELKQLPDEVMEADCDGRKDLRKLPLVTIDGADAKDFDDAVYCEPRKAGGWRLYVAIADVSHYVKTGMLLGKEAYRRGTSVYFPGRVIPMLPEKLSNGLCSLNPHVDRLCMVAEMSITAEGSIQSSRFYTAVIHSHARLTYDQVGAYLKGEAHPITPEIQPAIDQLYSLYGVLKKTRDQRGAIDFDTIETQIVFGEDKKIVEIVPAPRNDAHKLIEECMLCANVAAARFVETNKAVSLYRVHAPPGLDKVEKLRTFVHELGISFTKSDEPTPKDYAKLLEEIKTRPDQHIITMILLRTLSQAKYTPENEGHFGLAFKAYAHFTSPIRRYPDLLLHRAIKSVLAKENVSDDFKLMSEVGEHCSSTERRADEATRDATEWLKCEYMLDKVGEEFDGVISSVTSFGLFIELKSIYVEGLAHIQSLDKDYFQYDAIRHVLRGERTGVSYRLGDSVRIRVESVNLDDRQIDFSLILPEKKKKHVKK
jgi:ribonuclease R